MQSLQWHLLKQMALHLLDMFRELRSLEQLQSTNLIIGALHFLHVYLLLPTSSLSAVIKMSKLTFLPLKVTKVVAYLSSIGLSGLDLWHQFLQNLQLHSGLQLSLKNVLALQLQFQLLPSLHWVAVWELVEYSAGAYFTNFHSIINCLPFLDCRWLASSDFGSHTL